MSDDEESLLWKALLTKSRKSSVKESYSKWKEQSNILGLVLKRQILGDKFQLSEDEVEAILKLIGESNE